MAENEEQQNEEKPDLSSISETLAAMKGELATERTERAKLEGALSATIQQATQPAEPAPKPARRYTRSEINHAVEAGTITQMQGDQILEDQMRAEMRSEMDTRDAQITQRVTAEATLNAKKQSYIDAHPDCLVDGTADRAALQKAYGDLVSDGSPEAPATELAAMRLAFGPPMSEAARDKTAESRETDQSGSGGRPSSGRTEPDGPSAGLKLTDRQRTYYEEKIARGVYTDWDAVKAELGDYKGATAA